MKHININGYDISYHSGKFGNAYAGTKIIWKNAKVEEDKIIATSMSYLTEGVDFTLGDDQSGGMIIFSTDVNAEKLDNNKVKNWIKQKVATLNNRMKATKKVDRIGQSHGLIGWTLGHFLSGRYTAKNGKPYGENSLSLEIVGIDSDTLLNIATELCREFQQEAVMVKDYNTKQIIFVNKE
jgi:hypothetical protein